MQDNYELGLVSVVIPTYNRADVIVETLRSVFNQTYRPLEVIIVDDGSTDNTKDVVMNWSRNHKQDEQFRLSYFYQKNSGGSVSRNLGLIESRGQFIQFLDSDDLLAPLKIQHQVRQLSLSDSKIAVYGCWRFFEFIGGRFTVYKEGLKEIVENWDSEFDFDRWVAGDGFLPIHSFLWRRNDIQKIGPWNESFAANQDGEYFMRFVFQGWKFVFCPDAWVYWRFNSGYSDCVSSTDSLAAYEARFCMIHQLEKELISRKILNKYRTVLAIRYAGIANRYAFRSKKLTKICLERSRMLYGTGKVPFRYSYPLLTRLFGLTLKQRIGRLIRRITGIPISGDTTNHPVPEDYVNTVEEVWTFDEVGWPD